MIDYEKLKVAHEMLIASKIHATINHGVGIDWRGNQFGYIHLTMWDKSREPIDCGSMDDLIIKLHELTKPEPKYKVGSKIWVKDCEDEPIEVVFRNHVDFGFGAKEPNEYYFISENDCFPSRQALIEHQLQYWRAGLEDELEQHVSPYCEPFSTCCKKCNEEFSKCECNFKSECQPKHDHLWVRGKCHDCGAEKDECNHDGYMTCRKCGMSFKRAFL